MTKHFYLLISLVLIGLTAFLFLGAAMFTSFGGGRQFAELAMQFWVGTCLAMIAAGYSSWQWFSRVRR